MTDQNLGGIRWWIRAHQGNGSRHRPRPSLPAKKAVRTFDLRPPDDQWAIEVCKRDGGTECCRYLAITPTGWSCEKHSSFRAFIDRKTNAGEITARGDNCPGRGSADDK